MFYHPCLRSKEFSCETILALSLRQNVSFSIFRIPSYWEIGSRVTDSWHYVEKCQRKRFACCCYQKLRQTNFFKKTFGKYSQNWMLQSKEFNPANFDTSGITLKWHASKQEKALVFTGEIKGNFAYRSPGWCRLILSSKIGVFTLSSQGNQKTHVFYTFQTFKIAPQKVIELKMACVPNTKL